MLLPRLLTSLDTTGLDYEILILDRTVSTDLTHTLQSLSPKIRIINRSPTDCYGDAVRSGIKHSDGAFILFMDADGSHDPEFIETMLKWRSSSDVVIASRYIQGGGSFNGPLLKLMSLMVNLSYSIILNIPAKDVSNSFKLYNREVLKSLTLRSNNFDIIEEILYKALKNNRNLKIVEIPYFFKERIHGTTKRDLLSFSFSFLITLIRLRLS